MYLVPGVYLVPGGVPSPRGVSGPSGVPTLGVSAPGGGGGIPACTEADIPPVNIMTNRCKDITLATTSLRPVTTDLAAQEHEYGFLVLSRERRDQGIKICCLFWV